MNHKKLEILCEAYALGVLDQKERSLLEEHLQNRCLFCEKALSEFKAIVSSMSLAIEPVIPRPELKEKILAQVMQEARHEKGENLTIGKCFNAFSTFPLHKYTFK